MDNPKRKWEDIKQVHILADKLKTGWVAEIFYKDGKMATFSIDYGSKNRDVEDMLTLTYEAIRRQMQEVGPDD